MRFHKFLGIGGTDSELLAARPGFQSLQQTILRLKSKIKLSLQNLLTRSGSASTNGGTPVTGVRFDSKLFQVSEP